MITAQRLTKDDRQSIEKAAKWLLLDDAKKNRPNRDIPVLVSALERLSEISKIEARRLSYNYNDVSAMDNHASAEQFFIKEVRQKISAQASRARSRTKTRALVTLGRIAAKSLYETVQVSGRPIGDIWYSELHAIKKNGLFEAHICTAILHHGVPCDDKKVRGLIPEKTLASMVRAAQSFANNHQEAAAWMGL